ncbi:DNA repair protein RadA [bacterium]|nr:DNA repair protein RadA [bacterium]
MVKVKSKFVCQECGYESAGYLGKCPECGSWGSFVEETEIKASNTKTPASEFLNTEKPVLINDIKIDESVRVSTNISEFDRVLGGGLVQGSLVLIAGDPGIGKSTLVLQTSGELCKQDKKVLYVSAEESASQLKIRAERLGVNTNSLYIYPQTNLEQIRLQIKDLKPEFLIIDSIQSIYTNNITSSAGSVSQVRECCNYLMQIAKTENITVVVIGHVTKEGNIAGPKVLEHMVDAVIQFEGDKYKSYRLLRAVKNRFGTTSEVGMFDMHSSGLVEITNPSEIFLKENHIATPGSVIIVTNEGTRPLLLEIQALVGVTPYPSPRRVTNGVDTSRVLQILAVLEKRVGLNLSKQDVYVNVIGGVDVSEPAADLGVAVAIATCLNDVTADMQTVFIGEIGLSGEIRPVSDLEKRIYEAQKLGFKRAIVPAANNLSEKFEKIEIIEAKRIMDAIKSAITAKQKNN